MKPPADRSPSAAEVGAPHFRRVLTAAGLVSLLCFAVGSYNGTIFDQHVKNLGASVSKEFTTTTSNGGSDSSSSSSNRRTNRTNTTLHASNQQQESQSEPLRVVPSISLIANASADQGGGGGATYLVSSPWREPNLCQRNQIADGQWLPEHLKEPLYLPPSNITSCRPNSMNTIKDGWATYRWVPKDSVVSSSSNNTSSRSSCHFTEWNRNMFCELAKYATVMIIGDSLSCESWAGLVSLIGVKDPPHEGYQMMSRIDNVNVGYAVCYGRSRIVFRRDDYLTKVRNALFECESNIPQVLVLNRGAHYMNDTDLMRGIRTAFDVVEEWLGRCDQMNIKCHFFWRTTVPGHHHCRSFKEPVNDKAKMEKHVADLSQYTPRAIQHHWYDFQHQNLLVETELKKRTHLPHRILDGYRINVLRPDRHARTDCLHSCFPGKMDVYAQLLLHYLRSDRLADDVMRLRSVFYEQHWNLNVTTVAAYGPRPTA